MDGIASGGEKRKEDVPSRDEAPPSTMASAVRQARKLIVLVVGSTVVLIGVAMLVLPGPAIVVIPAGIAILATEFAWARRLLNEVKRRIGLERSGDPERGGPASDI